MAPPTDTTLAADVCTYLLYRGVGVPLAMARAMHKQALWVVPVVLSVQTSGEMYCTDWCIVLSVVHAQRHRIVQYSVQYSVYHTCLPAGRRARREAARGIKV